MDFLDPKKRRAHAIRLMAGYVLLGIAIVLGTTVLLYQANGFGVRQGKIIQNGLIFVSSRPGGASIYLNGQRHDQTNARLFLPAGRYTVQLRRSGYDTWQRAVPVDGNSVAHYDYPLLVPQHLDTSSVANYTAAPPLSMQTPDRRWLLIERPEHLGGFDQYDLKSPKKVSQSTTQVNLPATVLSDSATGSLAFVEASNDNRHILLQHTFGTGQAEYILLDRQQPEQSVNLTNQLQLPAGTVLSLANKKYDQYFAFDPAKHTLSGLPLGQPTTPEPLAANVLAYKTYGTDMALYASPNVANPNLTDIKLMQSGKTYTLRTVNADPTYLLDLARYDGDWYMAIGASGENRVYVYKNPADALNSAPKSPLVPKDILKVYRPNYIKFSANTQFVMVENAANFAVYDTDADKHYVYTITHNLDTPQTHADWMDGDRIMYVSGGKLLMFDYDGTNQHLLAGAVPAGAYFDRDYKLLYTLAPLSAVRSPAAGAVQILTSTSLLTADDQ